MYLRSGSASRVAWERGVLLVSNASAPLGCSEDVVGSEEIVNADFVERLESLPGKVSWIKGVSVEYCDFHSSEVKWRAANLARLRAKGLFG